MCSRSSSQTAAFLSLFMRNLPALHRIGKRRHFAASHPQLASFDFVLVFIQPARRRSRGSRAVFVVSSAVTRTQNQSGFLEPAHRTSQMRAVDGEHLKLVARQAAHPTGNVGRLPVPWACVRVAISGKARRLLGKIFESAKGNPGSRIFSLYEAREDESDQRNCKQYACCDIDRD